MRWASAIARTTSEAPLAVSPARNTLSASDFMYFTLGFIFYKYLSEKIEMYIDDELEADEMTFKEAWASDEQELKDEIREISMENLGYFIEPGFLYSSVIEAIKRKENILPMLERIADGTVKKFLKEVTLVNQPFVKDDKKSVGELVKAAGAQIAGYTLFIVGEGLEKRNDDFAAEVAAQMAAAQQK